MQKPRIEDSATTLLIDIHYENIGLSKPWTIDRVNRTAALLGITLGELGALCCISRAKMRFWATNDSFPTYAAKQFYELEQLYFSLRTGIKQSPVCPITIVTHPPE